MKESNQLCIALWRTTVDKVICRIIMHSFVTTKNVKWSRWCRL